MQSTIEQNQPYPTKGPFRVRLIPTDDDGPAIVFILKGQPDGKQFDAIFNSTNRWERDKHGNRTVPDAMYGKADQAYISVFDALICGWEGLLDLDDQPVKFDPDDPDILALVPIAMKQTVIGYLDTWLDRQTDIRLGGCIVHATVTNDGIPYEVAHVLRTPSLEEKKKYEKGKKLYRQGKQSYALGWPSLSCTLYDKSIQRVEGYDSGPESVPASHKYNVIDAMTRAGDKYASD
jgi:hypothetical protein